MRYCSSRTIELDVVFLPCVRHKDLVSLGPIAGEASICWNAQVSNEYSHLTSEDYVVVGKDNSVSSGDDSSDLIENLQDRVHGIHVRFDIPCCVFVEVTSQMLRTWSRTFPPQLHLCLLHDSVCPV